MPISSKLFGAEFVAENVFHTSAYSTWLFMPYNVFIENINEFTYPDEIYLISPKTGNSRVFSFLHNSRPMIQSLIYSTSGMSCSLHICNPFHSNIYREHPASHKWLDFCKECIDG